MLETKSTVTEMTTALWQAHLKTKHNLGKDGAKLLSCFQSCLTLCDPMDRSLQGAFVHGILQARILEWVAISFSRSSSQPRDWTHVSYISLTGRQDLYC